MDTQAGDLVQLSYGVREGARLDIKVLRSEPTDMLSLTELADFRTFLFEVIPKKSQLMTRTTATSTVWLSPK